MLMYYNMQRYIYISRPNLPVIALMNVLLKAVVRANTAKGDSRTTGVKLI